MVESQLQKGTLMKPTIVRLYNVRPDGKRMLRREIELPLTVAVDWLFSCTQRMLSDGWFMKSEEDHAFTMIRGAHEDACTITLTPTN
jgi:hypothetical protein